MATRQLAFEQPALRGQFGGLWEAASNWVWLSKLSRFDRAVVVGDEGGGSAWALNSCFQSVQTEPMPEVGKAAFLPKTRFGGFADHSLDCVVLGREVPVAVRRNGPDFLVALAEDARRVLRPGGCLHLGFGNPWSRARRADAPSCLSARLVRNCMQEAGFDDVSLFYAQPWFDTPFSLIPASPSAVRRHEALQHDRGRIRQVLVKAGVHSVIYPAYVSLCYS